MVPDNQERKARPVAARGRTRTPAPDDAPHHVPTEGGSSRGIRVLVVDDDPRCTQILARLLTDDGFEVQSVRSGAGTGSTGRLASVVSSLQALGEAAARELLAADDSPAVLVLSEAGHIVQVRVPGASLVLAALFDSDENAHGALTAARETADALALVTPREAL